MRAIVIGNCQGVAFSNLAKRMVPGVRFDQYEAHNFAEDFDSMLNGYDVAFVQPHIRMKISAAMQENVRVISYPRCTFSGLHPDLFYLSYQGQREITILSLHSAIIFGAWLHGLDEQETQALFRAETFDALNFRGYFEVSKKALHDEWASCGLDLAPHFQRWMREKEPFMLTMNHPAIKVMYDCTFETLRASGFNPDANIELPHHHLTDLACISVHPGYGESIGINVSNTSVGVWRGQRVEVDIPRWVKDSFARYNQHEPKGFDRCRAHDTTYTEFFENYKSKRRTKPSQRASNPYVGIPFYQNWRKAFGKCSTADVDPVVSCNFRISEQDRVATAGSCFAQHLARALQSNGLNYLVTEDGPMEKGYGLFSARFGNIYTAAQLDQLVDRAYGRFEPVDSVWHGTSGMRIDPFRPEIPIEGDVEEDRQVHFGCVRRMIEEADYFVFTLGLTEAWRSRFDGAVFPLAPGVAGGSMDDGKYEFVNFNVGQTFTSMKSAIHKMRRVNPQLKIILTVSPVPLMATFENRHVLVSTTYSKSVLRVVAERAILNLKDVHYFPSYEIITGSYTGGEYFNPDFRSVRMTGVNHVMKLFIKHGTTSNRVHDEFKNSIEDDNNVFCAEEMLDSD